MTVDIEWQAAPPHPDEEEEQQQMFPRIAKGKVVEKNELFKMVGSKSAYSIGTIEGVLEDFAGTLSRLLREGNTVSLPSLGTFRLSIGTDSKVTLSTKSPARKVKVRGVNFLPAKDFMKVVSAASFHTVARNAAPVVPSVQQLAASLSDYFQSHDSITRSEFSSLFGLKRTTAYQRLKELADMGVIMEVGHGRERRYVKG